MKEVSLTTDNNIETFRPMNKIGLSKFAKQISEKLIQSKRNSDSEKLADFGSRLSQEVKPDFAAFMYDSPAFLTKERGNLDEDPVFESKDRNEKGSDLKAF